MFDVVFVRSGNACTRPMCVCVCVCARAQSHVQTCLRMDLLSLGNGFQQVWWTHSTVPTPSPPRWCDRDHRAPSLKAHVTDIVRWIQPSVGCFLHDRTLRWRRPCNLINPTLGRTSILPHIVSNFCSLSFPQYWTASKTDCVAPVNKNEGLNSRQTQIYMPLGILENGSHW
jgi:hypothetical protein